VNESPCTDDVSLNFSNAVISTIEQDFISSPIISCLNFTGNNIQNIGKGAFNKLPNLTHLFLSNNKFRPAELFNFGGHDKLQVLLMDNATNKQYSCIRNSEIVYIPGEYPNLEILSLSKNCFNNLRTFTLKETPLSEFYFPTITSKIVPTINSPFPKLNSLDLSENGMTDSSFIELLPNNLTSLDLHDNFFNSLNLNGNNSKLIQLNLNNNQFSYISNSSIKSSLSLIGLTDLQYLLLSGNEINIIDSNAFKDNNKLLYLDLSHNYIKYLYPMTFANLKNLKTLDLGINQLQDVPQISSEIAINTLYINNNNIKKIMSRAFVQMTKLVKLSLRGNQIDEIDVKAFADVPALQELDLSRNMLSFLPQGWTEFLVSLKYLNLNNNKFTLLESLSLTNKLPLIEVYLMNNTLEYLNVGYFKNLPQNLTISIKSNFTVL